MTETRFDAREEEFYEVQNVAGHRPSTLVGFLMKISRGIIKEETANNILVVVTVVCFTLSAFIFSSMFFSQKNTERYKPQPVSKKTAVPIIKQLAPNVSDGILNQLPDTFYREDIPPDVARALSQEIINLIPPRP